MKAYPNRSQLPLAIISLLFLLLVQLTILKAQCDTFPVQQEWWAPTSNDGVAVIVFRNLNAEGSPNIFLLSSDSIVPIQYNFTTPGIGFSYSGVIGAQGQILFNLAGNGLRDSTYGLARGTDSLQVRNRSFSLDYGFSTNWDFQPLALPDPNSLDLARPERIFLFYTEIGSALDPIADQDSLKRRRARYLSVYDVFTGQLSVSDSVFTRGLTSATAAIRHPSGDGYWILMTSHVPVSRVLAYRLSSAGLDPTPVESIGEGTGPIVLGGPYDQVFKDLSDFQESLHFSPSGDRFARLRGPAFYSSPTNIELWDFDANTGQATFIRDIFRNISGNGGTAWSKSGNYVYVVQADTLAGQQASNSRDTSYLVRRKIDDPTLLTQDPLFPPPGDTIADYFFPNCTHSLGKGPNGRIYLGACDVLEVRDTDATSPDTATVHFDPTRRRTGFVRYPEPAVLDFNSSRIPRLRLLASANALPCAEQTEVVIPRTAFINPNDVQLELGPGFDSLGARRTGTSGDTLTVTFDATAHAGGQSFILAHHLHPCKTYSDTLHVFSQAPAPVLDTIRVCAGDSALIHNQWRYASPTSDTINFTASFAAVARPGCDSVSRVTLISLPHDSLFNTANVMAGDTLAGVVIGRQDTSFAVTLPGAAQNGCDLIVKYEVRVDTTSSIFNVPQRRGPTATLLELSAVNPIMRSDGLQAWINAEQGSASYQASMASGGCMWTIVRPDGQLMWRETTNVPQLRVREAQDWAAGLYLITFSSKDGRSRGQTRVVISSH